MQGLTDFFVVISTCGFFSCATLPPIDVPTELACVNLAKAYRASYRTCFYRPTGKIVWDSEGRK